MTTEIVYYKTRSGVNTRDPLKRLSPEDETWLHDVFCCYQILAELEPKLKPWFTEPNSKLPKLKERGTGYNSPKTWSEGICDKLNQAPGGRDLSPVQCAGIETLSKMMAERYDIPCIEFRDQAMAKQSATATNFADLFKKTKT